MLAPAPLPPGVIPVNPDDVLPVLPQGVTLPKPRESLNKRIFVNVKHRSHGKQFIRNYIRDKHGFGEIDYTELPNSTVLMYWLQREYYYKESDIFHLDSIKKTKPCIAHIPLQDLVCDKVKMAQTLYDYHGKDAWGITPVTYNAQYDFETQKWKLDDLKPIIESEKESKVWIVKSNVGSLGYEVHLFVGNNIDKLHEFLLEKYEPEAWQRKVDSQWYKNVLIDTVIVQNYLTNPLLWGGAFKFDLRVYVLVASTNPTVAFFHRGKMRMCGVKYNDDYSQVYGHLTNCKIQRTHENYEHGQNKIDGQPMIADWDDTVKFFHDCSVNKEMFGDEWFEHLIDKKKSGKITVEDVRKLVSLKCSRLMGALIDAVADTYDDLSKDLERPCMFTFHGADIMVDTTGKFWLIEVNRCPSVSLMGFPSIQQMTKDMLAEIVDMELEIRQMKLSGKEYTQDTKLKSVTGKNWEPIELHYLKKKKVNVDEEDVKDPQ